MPALSDNHQRVPDNSMFGGTKHDTGRYKQLNQGFPLLIIHNVSDSIEAMVNIGVSDRMTEQHRQLSPELLPDRPSWD